MSRELYDTLTEFGWVQEPATRKQIANLLAAEGVTETGLRKRLNYLERPAAMLTVLNPKKVQKNTQERNQMTETDQAAISAGDRDFVKWAVGDQKRPVESVAAQMSWPVEKVMEVCGL